MAEISHRKGHRYLTVVVHHDSGRLVWAAPGVLAFFDVLRKERCKALELISADMAAWISGPIAERAPQAERCVDLDRDRVREIGTDRRRTFRW